MLDEPYLSNKIHFIQLGYRLHSFNFSIYLDSVETANVHQCKCKIFHFYVHGCDLFQLRKQQVRFHWCPV